MIDTSTGLKLQEPHSAEDLEGGRLPNQGDPVSSAEVLELIAELYVPADDEKFVEAVERGGWGV
jgi:hypothetical protein